MELDKEKKSDGMKFNKLQKWKIKLRRTTVTLWKVRTPEDSIELNIELESVARFIVNAHIIFRKEALFFGMRLKMSKPPVAI